MTQFSFKRYLPRGLYGRAALILLVPIITLQLVVGTAFIQRLYERVTEQMTYNLSVEISLLLSAVDRAPNLAIAAGLAEAMGEDLMMEVSLPGESFETKRAFYDLSGRVMTDQLGRQFESLMAVDLRTYDGFVHLYFETTHGPMDVRFLRGRVSASNPHQLLVWMVLTGILMTVIAYLFMRNQLRPIRRLARAAEAFGKGRVDPYIPGGATEVRAAGTAFLDMRSRIERQIEQRTMMLSGVSHDLRTPLTRLKLGLSMQPETEETEALLKDATEMERLIEAFLDYAKVDAVEDTELCDPVSLVQDCVDDARRGGGDVSIVRFPERQVELRLRIVSIRRTLDNLISNAIRYGNMAEVSIELLENSIVIRVEDDGPGIPEKSREDALKPFARLDAARNQNKGSGMGLGLAIAADAVRSHGGVLELGNSKGLGGLSAKIVLPR